MLKLTSPLILSSLILAACTSAPSTSGLNGGAAAPSFLVADTGCTLITGGAIGDHFGEPTVDDFWFRANSVIVDSLTKQLTDAGANVIAIKVPISDRIDVENTTGKAIAANRCNRIAQLSHSIGSDSQGNFFQFELTVLRALPSDSKRRAGNGAYVSMQQEYKKSYRYRRSKESLDSFNIEDFAALMIQDLKTTQLIAKMR